jgi:hypothetical protein
MPRKPELIAYSVRNFEKDGQKTAQWLRIGVAWMHGDNKGIDVVLEALPVRGRISLRRAEDPPRENGSVGSLTNAP